MDLEKPGHGVEIELKLQVRSEDLSRLRDSPLLSSRGTGPGVTRMLESVYFDTADLRLRRKNTTLRVRKQGRRYVQTLKTGIQRRGGALHRGEWESPLPSAQPDVALLAGETDGHLGGLTASELRPVFASHIKRTVRRLENVQDTGG